MKIIAQKINIEDLYLDKDNPRLPQSMSNKSEDEIINFFLSDASLIELMLAIGINDFFEGEQLLVVEQKSIEQDETAGDSETTVNLVTNGSVQNIENAEETSVKKFIVIEGNRRLSAVKLLNYPEKAQILQGKVEQVISEALFFPTEIPCLIFPEKGDITKYLGFRHITGIKPWKLLEKARYIKKLKDDYYSNLTIQSSSRQIAKMIGSRMDYVRRILVGYEIYSVIEKNDFYKIKDLNDVEFHFNYVADSLGRSNIADFLGAQMQNDNPSQNLNYKNIKEWTNWLFNKELPNKIIGDSEHLNNLNKVLMYEEALKAFRSGVPLDKALEYTDKYNDRIQASIKGAIGYLEDADGISHKVTFFYIDLVNDLQEISKLIRKIKRAKDDFESENLGDELL